MVNHLHEITYYVVQTCELVQVPYHPFSLSPYICIPQNPHNHSKLPREVHTITENS